MQVMQEHLLVTPSGPSFGCLKLFLTILSTTRTTLQIRYYNRARSLQDSGFAINPSSVNCNLKTCEIYLDFVGDISLRYFRIGIVQSPGSSVLCARISHINCNSLIVEFSQIITPVSRVAYSSNISMLIVLAVYMELKSDRKYLRRFPLCLTN